MGLKNKDHSEVMFQVPYMTVSELSGRFGDYEARVDFDEKTLNRKYSSHD